MIPAFSTDKFRIFVAANTCQIANCLDRQNIVSSKSLSSTSLREFVFLIGHIRNFRFSRCLPELLFVSVSCIYHIDIYSYIFSCNRNVLDTFTVVNHFYKPTENHLNFLDNTSFSN